MENELYNVVQFFQDGQYEYVRRAVSAEEAVKAAAHYTRNVAVRMGVVHRVIITDMMDMTCFEWKDGKIIFPTAKEMDEVSDELEKN